jgi:glutathione S-transferase
MADEFVVFGVPGSPYVRAVLLGLLEKGLPWRLSAMKPGEARTPSYLERHPFGRVPLVEHDGFTLYETQAILRYIDAVAPEPPLQPADARDAARMNQMIGIVDWYFFPKVSATIAFNRIVAPMMGMACDEVVIANAIPEARLCFRAIDALLGDKAYLACDQLTIADLMLAPQMDFQVMTPEGRALLEPHPRLAAWIERMNARDSMRQTRWEALRAAAA